METTIEYIGVIGGPIALYHDVRGGVKITMLRYEVLQ